MTWNELTKHATGCGPEPGSVRQGFQREVRRHPRRATKEHEEVWRGKTYPEFLFVFLRALRGSIALV